MKYKGYWDNYLEKDGAIAAAYIMLAARALGYGSVMLTGSVSEETCRQYFKVPNKYLINCLIPIGVPDGWPRRHERKPLSELIFHEKITKG